MSPFSLDKGSKPQGHIHAILLNQLYELHQISSSRKVELMKTKNKKNTSRILMIYICMFYYILLISFCFNYYLPLLRLMYIPENVCLNRVQTALFRSLNDTWPHLNQIQIT